MRTLSILCLLVFVGGCHAAGNLGGTSSRSYEVLFEGNASVPRRQLATWIQLDLEDFDRSESRSAYIDDAAYDIEIGYQGLGYPFAKVEYQVSGGTPPKSIRFLVEEGPHTQLESVVFEGMERLTRANFDQGLASKRTSLLQGSQPYFVERDIKSALAAMVQEYVDLGYLDASVTLSRTTFNEDQTRASIAVKVVEGDCFRIGRVSITSQDLKEEVLEQYRKQVAQAAARDERVWRTRTGYELRGMLLEALAHAGYADATVEYHSKQRADEPLIDLEYKLLAGAPILIGRVVLPENLTTREAFLRSRVELKEGDIYDSKKVRESVQNLYETGLFTRVTVELEESDAEHRDLKVALTESPRGEFFIEPGYGSFERARLQLGFRQKNLWGTGRLLRIEGTYGDLAQRATLGISDPWFLGSRFSADFSLTYERRELPSFTEESAGAGVFWTRDWNSKHSTSFGYQYRRSQLTDVVAQESAALEAQDQLNISSIQVTQRFDSRDNFFLPTHGSFHELALEFGDEALASDLDFLRTSLRLSAFSQPFGATVLAGAFRTGIIQELGSGQPIPLQERFFSGGQNTVRSFRYNELGRKDAGGNPLGGEAYSVANIELRQPLSPRFQGALFLDAGNITARHSDAVRFADVELGVGVGLRYLLPIGPVRVDVGFNPDRVDGDPTYVIHFSIGMAF